MTESKRTYKQVELGCLERFESHRDIRKNVVAEIVQRLEESGYNPAKPLRVFQKNGAYKVADGNHRLQALRELGKPEAFTVPCAVEPDEADPVTVAIESNRDEDTFATQDLFDYLDRIDNLRDDHTQAEIGDKVGWSRDKVARYNQILEKVVTEVVELARKHQTGRVTQDCDSCHNFTEGWFRNSGIYDLNEEFQRELMDWFVNEKGCNTSQSQVQKHFELLKERQTQLKILCEQLNPGVEARTRERLEQSIRDGEYTTESLQDAIENANHDAKNQSYFGVDALKKLPELPDNSIDCVITDPPYGVDYTNHRDSERPEFGTDIDDTLALLDAVFIELQRVCKANAHIYLWFPMNRYEEIVALTSDYFDIQPVPLIWVKNNHAPTRNSTSGFDKMYAHQYESALVCRMANGDQRELNGGVCPNVLHHDVPKGDNRWHNSQKPRSLLRELLTNSTGVAETVLDPFAGSGATMLAAEECDRHYIGIEQSSEYESRFKKELRKVKNGA